MLCEIVDSVSGDTIRTENHDPECGLDFCQVCGDCLACYGANPCCPDGTNRERHRWVRYELAARNRLYDAVCGPWSGFLTSNKRDVLDDGGPLSQIVHMVPELLDALEAAASQRLRVYDDMERAKLVANQIADVLGRVRRILGK